MSSIVRRRSWICFGRVGLAVCARGDDGRVAGCVAGLRREVKAPGKMRQQTEG